ncbi:Hypothetical predicted protein, partial [Paramuricea clavata]
LWEPGDGSRNITMTINTRNGRPPNAGEMMALRIIMLIIAIGAILKDVLQIVDKKLLELTGKIKALNFAIKKSDEVIDSTKTEVLTRQISSITNRIQAIYALKEEIEEIKFTDNDSEENIRDWAEEIESRIRKQITK